MPASSIDTDTYRVDEGTKVHLPKWPTSTTDGFNGGKGEGAEALKAMNLEFADLQQMLYADGRHKFLVVLQGMDTSGKDGTIKHVFHTINPLGVKVANFKKPNEVELAHDYLWRVHANTPRDGRIVIFNRSHYEDVLVVRVHDLVPEDVWRRRYRHILEWERMLADEGTTIVKFFLHISRDEQRDRLLERLENPAKHWKFEHGDLEERKLWDEYTAAYEDAISETSTERAPWYVVPADRKWYRNLVISQVLIETLRGLHLAYPEPTRDLATITIDD
jgi:PPK2 family polyphosphate:nucleotide phosphotransferase